MKNLKTYLMVLFASLAMTSCLVDDEAISDANGQSPNLIGFTTTTATAAVPADGEPRNFQLPMSIVGPQIGAVNESAVAQISVDPSSTAVSGTHFLLDQTTITLSPDQNLLNNFNLTILTEGFAPPLAVSPYLILNISSVTGANGALVNGRTGKIKITINYLCSSDLAGTYDVVTRYVRASSGIDQTTTSTDVINEIAPGVYRTGSVGHWAPSDLGGTPGMEFSDVCNEITIPEQNLVELYSNLVTGVAGSSFVDPESGVIYFEYTICATDCRQYFVTYTPN